MAGSGSIGFSPAVHLPSPKHLAFASPGNDAGGSILAAKVAHFLAATDICAGKSVGAVGALWPNNRAFQYPDERPREVLLPRESSGRMFSHSPRAQSIVNETLARQSSVF